jgi:transcriptional regulator with XRE-family HTH domain
MIYQNIQKLAAKKGITIQKLEMECGLTSGIIAKWRDNNNPKIENLKKVADYFHVSVDKLLKEEG